MVSKYAAAFAENLKELIGNQSVIEFSQKIGIPHQTISRYLRCEREVSLFYLCKIADYFNEDLDVLVGRREY